MTGRHDLEPDKRFCPFCLDKVENEAHFLLKCTVLRHLRKTYLTPITNSIPGFEFFPENFKLKALLVDMKYEVCKFIAEATDLIFLSQNRRQFDSYGVYTGDISVYVNIFSFL